MKIKNIRPTNITDFMDDFYKQTTYHPFDDRQRIFKKELVGVELYPSFENKIHLSFITSYGEKGAGNATAVLKKLIALADKHKVNIDGNVKAVPLAGATNMKSLTDSQLKKWYKKLGFTVSGNQIEYQPR